MNNLSFHITDIASNSIRAQAPVVEVAIRVDAQWVSIRITDNGCGMLLSLPPVMLWLREMIRKNVGNNG